MASKWALVRPSGLSGEIPAQPPSHRASASMIKVIRIIRSFFVKLKSEYPRIKRYARLCCRLDVLQADPVSSGSDPVQARPHSGTAAHAVDAQGAGSGENEIEEQEAIEDRCIAAIVHREEVTRC